jgi:hypothetical protein
VMLDTERFNIFVRSFTGQIFPIKVHMLDTLEKLKEIIEAEVKPSAPALDQIITIRGCSFQEKGSLLINLGITEDCTIYVRCRLKGDIGTFVIRDTGSFGCQYLLQGGNTSAVKNAPIEDCISLINMFGSSMSKVPTISYKPILDKHQRQLIVKFMDQEWSANKVNDLVIEISSRRLLSMIGMTALGSMRNTFRECSSIKLRRTTANEGRSIHFHTDASKKTMQVVLNENEDDCNGGRLVFATCKGFIVPCRLAGSCTIHEGDILHGVTALQSGVRYSLFLLLL